MKNLLIVLTVIIMSTTVFGQATYYKYLQNTYDSTTAANYDTLFVQQLGKKYPVVSLTIENVGAVPCTLSVLGVSFYRDAESWQPDEWQYPVTDTVTYSVWLKNAAGDNATSTSIIVANGASASYLCLKPDIEAIMAKITQSAGGKVKILIEPSKTQ